MSIRVTHRLLGQRPWTSTRALSVKHEVELDVNPCTFRIVKDLRIGKLFSYNFYIVCTTFYQFFHLKYNAYKTVILFIFSIVLDFGFASERKKDLTLVMTEGIR